MTIDIQTNVKLTFEENTNRLSFTVFNTYRYYTKF